MWSLAMDESRGFGGGPVRMRAGGSGFTSSPSTGTLRFSCRPAYPGMTATAGTTDWMLQNTRVDPKTKYRCPWIEGYCSHTSIRAGDTLSIMVSTNPPSAFTIDIYRLGYYGGKGGRHLLQLGRFKGKVQPDPDIGEERL